LRLSRESGQAARDKRETDGKTHDLTSPRESRSRLAAT
jgi:hypothetical protein